MLPGAILFVGAQEKGKRTLIGIYAEWSGLMQYGRKSLIAPARDSRE